MKNSIKCLIAFISLISLSCTNDVEDVQAVTADKSFKLLTPTSDFNLVLDGAKLNDLATTFVWNDPANATGTDVTYTVEAAKTGTNFAAPVVIGSTKNQYLDVTVGKLDATAKSIGLPALTEGQMDVRIKISGDAQISNFYTIKVTPYLPNWGIIGSATPLGWDNSTDMAFNPINGTYSISLALTTGAFKFRLDNAWTTNYGDDAKNLSLESGGADILVTAGNYTIVANFTTKTYTITPIIDAWGIIGDATTTGWGSDTLLDYNSTTNKYSITMKMKLGSFKFRLNHDWGTNYGDDGNNLSLDNGGSNIAITDAGTYHITVDFTGLTYTIKKL